MKIVIVGVGAVGSAICSQLAGEGHDITLVDTNSDLLSAITNKYDVFGVSGNGADISVLRKASAEKADLLIAVTSSDEINILCTLAAKKFGIKQTIARIRNPEYENLTQLIVPINTSLPFRNQDKHLLQRKGRNGSIYRW